LVIIEAAEMDILTFSPLVEVRTSRLRTSFFPSVVNTLNSAPGASLGFGYIWGLAHGDRCRRGGVTCVCGCVGAYHGRAMCVIGAAALGLAQRSGAAKCVDIETLSDSSLLLLRLLPV